MPPKYSIYVVELSKSIFTESAKFRSANPQYNGVLECLYVGLTSKDPKIRLKQHKGVVPSKKGLDISSRLVKKYGLYLRPSLSEHLKPKNRADALKLEKELTLELRRKRYAVWGTVQSFVFSLER